MLTLHTQHICHKKLERLKKKKKKKRSDIDIGKG